MATKSIFKNICINDNNTAERLACALEHTSEKKEIDFAAPSYAGIPQTTQNIVPANVDNAQYIV